MNKGVLTFFTVLCLLSAMFLMILTLEVQPVKADLRIIYVDDNNTTGPWDGSLEHPYQNITSGLRHASSGDTIFVHNGTYYEHIIVNKSVSLIGENKSATIIDGSGTGTVVKISASDVSVTGFTIRGSGRLHPCGGISVEHSSNCTIKDNILTDNLDVVYLSFSNGNVITGNEIINNRHFGIRLGKAHRNIICGNLLINNLDGVYSYFSNSNEINHNTIVTNREDGLFLVNSGNNIVSKNNITNNKWYGVLLIESSNCNSITGNNITANRNDGIGLYTSNNNTVCDNNIIRNHYGVRLNDSLNNSITGNKITNNYAGLYLAACSNNTLRNNIMTNNTRNFGVWGETISHFVNDVDASNTVDSKPIYYWINEQDINVPLDAGFVGLVSCKNITVKNLNLKNNFQGMLLAYTTYSTITNNNVTGNLHGVHLTASNCNIITKNFVMSNKSLFNILFVESTGIHLDHCDNCTINENIAYNNFYGMLVNSSTTCTIEENNAYNNTCGFYFNKSTYCVVRGNDAMNNWYVGIKLKDCNLCRAGENIVDDTEHFGIYLDTCTRCLLNENVVKNASICIELRYCNDITLRRNDARDSDFGIHLLNSRNCTLRDNNMVGNKYNFGIDESFFLVELIHDIDVSNKVDGKPIYYLVNQHNRQIPNDAGYVAVVNSTGIRVENLYLTHNTQGLLLAFTNHSTVQKTIIPLNAFGIQLRSCYNCTISGNNVSNNDYDGIALENSHYCTIARNNVNENHQFGIHMWNSTNNIFFHNNFIQNTWQVLITRSFNNAWDTGYPSGGNYWSDYDATDMHSGIHQDETGYDWIGDSSYFIDENKQDNYPLIDPYVPERQETRVAYRNLLGKYSELLSDPNSLNSTYRELLDNYGLLQGNYTSLLFSYNNLQEQYIQLQSNYEAITNELNNIRNLMYILTATTIIFIATTLYLVIRKPKIKT